MKKIKDLLSVLFFGIRDLVFDEETKLLALGTMLSNQQTLMHSTDIGDYEFRIFSQWGDDGIIQYLIRNIYVENETFIEFGVQNYRESNTRFLLMHNNWSGFVMDGSKKRMEDLKKQPWYWKYDITSKAVFIDKDNINDLLSEPRFHNLGILSIDLDGNDYHILEAIDFSKLNPSILILEYNSVFGVNRLITVPYKEDFDRTSAHFSNLFFGASLGALCSLANKKGYALVGGTKAGNNAYFVRKDLLNDTIKPRTVKEVYKVSKSRESRDENYNLSLLRADERFESIRGLDVLNIETNMTEAL